MTTEQFLLAIFAGIGAIWAVFKVILPRFVDAKIKADEYERARSAFREDKSFEMLEDTLEHWKATHSDERLDTLSSQKLQTDLIAGITKLANSIERQMDIIRIMGQQVSVFNDRLLSIEDKIEGE